MLLVSEYLEKESQQGYLLKYLMLKLAPVLVKLKPSSLLALCNCEKSGRKNNYDLWEEQKEDIAKTLGLSFKELKDTSMGKQVLFYNPQVLLDTVTQPENLAYLKRFGYSSCEDLEDYLEVLKKRFCSGASPPKDESGRHEPFGRSASSFPHEIGIFLGYPLKDVKGFIEKGSLPLTKVGNWKVFGEPEKSMQLMQIHKKAEVVFLKFIENRRNSLSFTQLDNRHLTGVIERLGRHFEKAKDIIAIQVS